jgi:hypothetical protein
MPYVSHTDYLKFPSGRSVGNCRKDAKKLQRTSGQAFHAALNDVAKNNGLSGGWDKALSALLSESIQRVCTFNEKISIAAINSFAKRNPSLTQYGLGILGGERATMLGLTVEEFQQREHDSLPDMLVECSRVLAFVSLLVPQREVNSLPTRTSYELKHAAEKAFRHVTPGIYVPHGAFIIAALFQGFLPQRCAPNSASVFFNISEESPILQWDGQLDNPIASVLMERLDFYSRL